MKPDERRLLRALADYQRAHGDSRGRPFADAVGAEFGMNHKRVTYLLLKWADKGWWDYGVSARTGWLTAAGLTAARDLT